MARHGYLVGQDVNGRTQEFDTTTCVHCNKIVAVRRGSKGGWCPSCAGVICEACNRIGRCTPFEKKLEAVESRSRFLKAVGV